MRPTFFGAILSAVVASSSFAMADQATGTVKAFDAKAMTLTLDNGVVYHLPKTFKDPGLKAGEKVSVAWAMKKGQYDASSVTVEKS